jgi:hypothetical protein
MGWVVLPAPGKVVDGVEIGPCVAPCKHTDCVETRALAASLCRLCGQPIGYERPFYRDPVDGPSGVVCYVHARCLLEE